jgi:hypothetical protein
MAARTPVQSPKLRGAGLRLTLAGLAAIVALAIPATASATFHEILVREVYAGGAANDSYIVLQAYAGGQNLLNGHSVTAYSASGTQIGTFTFTGSVSNSADQMTVLIADSSYAATFPGGPTPDGTEEDYNLSPAGGGVCWAGLDCVSWGNFTGTLTSTAGTPAVAMTTGMALRRTIAAGNCVDRLDFGDDTNDSATDFSLQSPHPRSNSSPIEETGACVPPNLPTTMIESRPPNPTKSTTATFTYDSSSASAEFECSLDSTVSFVSCEASGITYDGPLSAGSHTFRVRAKDSNGTGSAASYSWTIDVTAPTVTIDKAPADPSPGGSASFNFHAGETATFQCELEGPTPSSLSACTSGKTYLNLADGDFTFKVIATDKAGNTGSAATYTWVVDNTLADTTPPETTLLSKPPDPSESSSGSFTYSSNEPDSSFECKLDGGSFAACPPTGVSYAGLGNGGHSFQVRAKDGSGNADESPAGYSWTVAAPSSTQLPAPPAGVLPAPSARGQIPQTAIVAKPPAKTRDRTPTLRFKSTLSPAAFQCKIDRKPFRPCHSPLTLKVLGYGRHTVRVRAQTAAGADPTPAVASFKIIRRQR